MAKQTEAKKKNERDAETFQTQRADKLGAIMRLLAQDSCIEQRRILKACMALCTKVFGG